MGLEGETARCCLLSKSKFKKLAAAGDKARQWPTAQKHTILTEAGSSQCFGFTRPGQTKYSAGETMVIKSPFSLGCTNGP